MTKLLCALAAALSLVVLAGCGGDTASKNDYVEAVNKAQTDFAASVGNVQAGSAENPEAIFDRLEKGLDQIVADLEKVEPPEEVKSLHDKLIDDFSKFSAVVKDAGESIGSGSQKKILEAQQKFGTEAAEIGGRVSATITEINSKLQE
jgi:hypothetical protein